MATKKTTKKAKEQKPKKVQLKLGALPEKVQLWKDGPYWATTNIGAEKPEDFGYYFWWGDTVGYKYVEDEWVAVDGTSTNFSFEAHNTPTFGDDKDFSNLKDGGWITDDLVLAPEHDAAHVHWGGGWRMPTEEELKNLLDKCRWTRKKVNGVQGYVVRGKGDYAAASIFLPCAGVGDGTSLTNAGSLGDYWSSVPTSDYYGNNASWYLYFNSSDHYTSNDGRYYCRDLGRSVRPVQGHAHLLARGADVRQLKVKIEYRDKDVAMCQSWHDAVFEICSRAYSIGFMAIDSLDEMKGAGYDEFSNAISENYRWYGLDLDHIGASLSVDGAETHEFDVSKCKRVEDGKANSWSEFYNKTGIYANDCDWQSLVVEFRFKGTVDPSKLEFHYKTVAWEGAGLKLLCGISYDGEMLHWKENDPDNKGLWMLLVDKDRYAEYNFGCDLAKLKWQPIPSEDVSRKRSKGKKSATKGGKAKAKG